MLIGEFSSLMDVLLIILIEVHGILDVLCAHILGLALRLALGLLRIKIAISVGMGIIRGLRSG